MPISINDFRINLLDNANKNRFGGLPPGRMDNFLQQASIELLNEKYLSATQNNKLDDDLAPFLQSVNLPISTPDGVNYGLMTRPIDYTYFWSLRGFFTENEGKLVSCGCPTSDNKPCEANNPSTIPPSTPEVPLALIPIVKEVNVQKLDAGRWSAVLMHRTKYPTIDKPVCCQFSNGLKIAPRDLQIVTLDFYRLPVKAHFGYTLLPSGYFLYDPLTSINIEWGEQVKNELIDRTLKLYAMYLRDPVLFSTANDLKATRV